MMQRLLRHILERLYGLVPGLSEESNLQRHLSRGTIGTLTIHFTHIGLTLLISVLLARWLGAEAYGSYTHVLTWLMVLGTAASVGADDLLVRELPQRHSTGAQMTGKALVRETLRLTLVSSTIIGVVFLTLLNTGLTPWLTSYQLYFNRLIPVLPFLAFCYWAMAGLKAEQHLLSAQWPEKIARPAVFLLSGICWLVFVGPPDLRFVAFLLAGVIVGTSLVYAVLFLKKVWPVLGTDQPRKEERIRWYSQLAFFALLPVLNILNQRIDILLLGRLADDQAIGIYSIASRLTEMIPFSLILFQNVFSPLYARYHSQGQTGNLQRLVRKGIQLSLLLAAPVALLLLVAGPIILGWFGEEFKSGYSVILVLTPVQIVSLAIGPLAFLLMMTGHGKAAFIIMTTGLLFTALLQSILIPLYGAQGAAFGRGAGLLATQATYAWITWKLLGIKTL